MDAKQFLKNYLSPRPWFLIVTVAAFVIGFLFVFIEQSVAFTVMMLDLFPVIIALSVQLPSIVRYNKCIKELEAKGLVEHAAGELSSQGATPICNNKAVVTQNYLFIKKSGVVCPVSDIVWTYKHRHTTTFFLIPIYVVDSIYICTARKLYDICLGKKDKKGLLTPAIMELYKRNPRMMVGHTPENKKAYDQIVKQAKLAAKNK